MTPDINSLTRHGAVDAVASWKRRGCEYASIIDGVPRPWEPEPFERIAANAASRGVELLSLKEDAHVARLLTAICQFIERSLTASQAQAETRKAGAILSRGGEA